MLCRGLGDFFQLGVRCSHSVVCSGRKSGVGGGHVGRQKPRGITGKIDSERYRELDRSGCAEHAREVEFKSQSRLASDVYFISQATRQIKTCSDWCELGR